MMRDMTCYFSQDNGAKIGSILLRMDAMASMGGVIGQGRRNRVGWGGISTDPLTLFQREGDRLCSPHDYSPPSGFSDLPTALGGVGVRNT